MSEKCLLNIKNALSGIMDGLVGNKQRKNDEYVIEILHEVIEVIDEELSIERLKQSSKLDKSTLSSERLMEDNIRLFKENQSLLESLDKARDVINKKLPKLESMQLDIYNRITKND